MSASSESPVAIAVPPPTVPDHAISAAIQQQFGYTGELRQLVSERDQNFRLTAGHQQFVAKVVSADDTAVQVDFQIEALRHLERRGVDGVPRVIQTLDGASSGRVQDSDGHTFILRLVTWLDGDLRLGAPDQAAAAGLGRKMAELHQAFGDFSHPGQDQSLLWDVRRVLELLPLTHCISEIGQRKLVEQVLQQFEQHALVSLQTLPQQIIHNDLNGGNVLYCEDEVSGIIDFGDMLAAPRVVDIAVAAAYQRDLNEPCTYIAPLVQAYNSKNELLQAERDLLFDLVCARLCTTTIMLHWRLAERDADDPYRQKTLAEESEAADFLAALTAMGRRRFKRELTLD